MQSSQAPNPSGGTGHAPAVGVDLGATLAKIAQRDDAGRYHLELMPSRAIDRLAATVSAMGPASIGLTGGGAARLADLLDLPSQTVAEFDAWGTGAGRLLDPQVVAEGSRYLLVSLGTGTSVLLIEGDRALRVGGTALGGGTVLGLGSALTGASSFEELCLLASKGSRRHVDLVVSDIYPSGELPLPGEFTAASFGKLGLLSDAAASERKDTDDGAPEHLAAAVMGLVGENVGLICGGLAAATQAETIVFGGSTLRSNPALVSVLEGVMAAIGRKPHFLPDGEFGGALGALELARTGSP
jgi:type II pantothenate kinase